MPNVPDEFTPYGEQQEQPAPLSAMEWFLIGVVLFFVGAGIGVALLVRG